MNAYTCFVYVCECYQELSSWRGNACLPKIGSLAIGIVGRLFATPASLSAQTAATTHTVEMNAAVKVSNRQDFEDAQRGFIVEDITVR